MRSLESLVASVFLSFTAFDPAFAQVIDDETKCATATKIIDDPSSDDRKVREVVGYITTTMRALDRAHGLKGRAEMFPQMTEEGQAGIALVAASRCRGQDRVTIEDVALQTYEAVRAMQGSLGLNEAQRKQAASPMPRRYWKASSHNRRQNSQNSIRSAQGGRAVPSVE